MLTGCVGFWTKAQLTYTDAQAHRGREIYLQHCVLCHGTDLSNAQFGAPLKGTYFQSRWRGKTVAELYMVTQATMPTEKPMSLQAQDYADVIAYVLQANGLAAGHAELPTDLGLLMGQALPW